jgi:hypothetical protein
MRIERSWIRKGLWYSGGAVGAVALLFLISQALAWVTALSGVFRPSPLMNSRIRVVGGGVTVQLWKNLTFSTDSKNQLSVANADVGIVVIDHVFKKNGLVTTATYPRSQLRRGSKWKILAYVNDPPGTPSPSRGVEIDGDVGTTLVNGNITFTTMNNSDKFVKAGADRQYQSGSGNCPSSVQCQTLLKILVYQDAGSDTYTPWFCSKGECNINIGAP